MRSSKISVVIIDDSAFMRKSLSIMLESDESIEIVATARDGLEGYNTVKKLRPDLVTLDIEMPKMDGLTALKKIMADCPTSVLMVSSLTTEGAESTLKALELGAVDFIPKELSFVNVNIINIKEDLIKKVKAIVNQKRSQERLSRLKNISAKPRITAKNQGSNIPDGDYRAIALGISTGGPLSLQKVIPQISSNINVPIFIVQHMPPRFTKSLAERLNNMSSITVKEAEHGEEIRKGVAYIAPGGMHMIIKKNNILISDSPANTLHKPSVDVMMHSVIDVFNKKTLGIIMTGMGKDGLEAMKRLKQINGTCIAQDERSSVVYGMPKAVIDEGIADSVLSLEEIPLKINKVFSNERRLCGTNI
jgi:two-component system chemotaxis response regulator CheB